MYGELGRALMIVCVDIVCIGLIFGLLICIISCVLEREREIQRLDSKVDENNTKNQFVGLSMVQPVDIESIDTEITKQVIQESLGTVEWDERFRNIQEWQEFDAHWQKKQQ